MVEKKLKVDWSPEQISGRLRLDGELSISHETIYIHVWRNKEDCTRIAKKLNTRPRKRLGYRTPVERFHGI
jgi:IS30 family transposase